MNIRGIYKTSLIDYPGKICTVFFSGGCNLRCRYCHNSDLACNSSELPQYTDEEALALLVSRKHLIDAVTLSGGEPTLFDNIEWFAASIRDIGLSVKVDTNGLRPDVISALAGKQLIDYVALDIKTSPEKYSELAGVDIDFAAISETVTILKSSSIEYEIRTTCVPGYVTNSDLESIGEQIGTVKQYYLQQFRNDADLIDEALKTLQPYPIFLLDELCKTVLTFSEQCGIRGK